MTAAADAFASLPPDAQAPFRGFVQQLVALAGENLLAVSAFGGWLYGDPLYRGTPARSVVLLHRLDLRLLAALAAEGQRHAKRGLQAPLIMTPEQLAASADVFPLELLEIQQLNVTLLGQDHFAGLQFAPADVRLQCEREVRSELIHLNQGLLSTGSRSRQLAELCRHEAERAVRVLRGVLHMAGQPLPRLAAELAAQAAACTGLQLEGLSTVLAGGEVSDLGGFERFYNDLLALAGWLDHWRDRPPEAPVTCASPRA